LIQEQKNEAGLFAEHGAWDALSLAGRAALVTGGTLGIGRSIALLMARRGARVAAHHSSAVDAAMGYPDAAQALQADAAGDGATIACLDIDLMRPDAGRQVVRDAATTLGRIDVLVHAASVQVREPFAAVTADTLERQIRVDFAATVELLQQVVPIMVAQQFGRIIAIGSINQVRPHHELSVYAALKAAQHNLVVGIAKQHAGSNVTANTLSPGLIHTPRNDFRRRDMDEWDRIQKTANPMGRAGTADEVAEMAALLAAPAGAFVTGADIAIDGGGRL